MSDFLPDPKPEKTQKKSPQPLKRIAIKKTMRLPGTTDPEKNGLDLDDLIQILDLLFSIYRRKMSADERGNCTCCTCGHQFHWNKIQNGHFIKREIYIIRWSTLNTAPQCKDCNEFNDGREKEFAMYIDRAYGAGTVDELKQLRHQPFKLEREWLRKQIAETKSKLELLKYIQ